MSYHVAQETACSREPSVMVVLSRLRELLELSEETREISNKLECLIIQCPEVKGSGGDLPSPTPPLPQLFDEICNHLASIKNNVLIIRRRIRETEV
jgi:hypothetical protein